MVVGDVQWYGHFGKQCDSYTLNLESPRGTLMAQKFHS